MDRKTKQHTEALGRGSQGPQWRGVSSIFWGMMAAGSQYKPTARLDSRQEAGRQGGRRMCSHQYLWYKFTPAGEILIPGSLLETGDTSGFLSRVSSAVQVSVRSRLLPHPPPTAGAVVGSYTALSELYRVPQQLSYHCLPP